jgi:hypothetical protein
MEAFHPQSQNSTNYQPNKLVKSKNNIRNHQKPNKKDVKQMSTRFTKTPDKYHSTPFNAKQPSVHTSPSHTPSINYSYK